MVGSVSNSGRMRTGAGGHRSIWATPTGSIRQVTLPAVARLTKRLLYP